MTAPSNLIMSSDVALVLGIMASPEHHVLREAIRKTWLQRKPPSVKVRFVIGASRPVSCCQHCHKEARKFGDIAFVNTSDCSPVFASQKVHRWYKFAIQRFPTASFYAKAEDDSMLHLSGIMGDLQAVSSRMAVDYYGTGLQWIAHCRTATSPLAHDWEPPARSCARGCWLNRLRYRKNGPPRCTRSYDGYDIVGGSAECPMLTYALFAPGPLEVRSRRLTALIASCSHADAYFNSLVSRGVLINDECASTDGSQGLAIADCVAGLPGERLIMADGDPHQQAYPSRSTANHLQALNRSSTLRILVRSYSLNRGDSAHRTVHASDGLHAHAHLHSSSDASAPQPILHSSIRCPLRSDHVRVCSTLLSLVRRKARGGAFGIC
jgi:hypothetical protein